MFDVRDYRRAVRSWRQDYARLSASIRQAKRDAVQNWDGQPDRQRTLALLQAMATGMLMERQEMKDYWRVMNVPLPLAAVI